PEARTDMAAALRMVAEEMKMPPLSPRALPPAIVLISDGRPTDDFELGMQTLLAQPWGKASTRLAIGIGSDAHQKTLKRFIDNPEIQVLQADNPEALVEYMRFVSTSVLSGRRVVPAAPQPGQAPSSNIIW
ncbi:MAG: vWA domain-containing protein, partial [Bryobacteraceae bacterium]